MDCNNFKEFFGSNDEICLYLRDSDGFIVPLSNGTHVKYGVGCPGVIIGNITCGLNISG